MNYKKLNKKAFQLSVNFLVTMIIMVVIFGFGIYLFTTVFNQAIKMDTEIHEQETYKLNMLLDDGSLVSVLNPQQTYGKDGLRFPIGITNENGAASNEFKIKMDVCTFNDDSQTGCSNGVVQYFSEQFEIKNNERKYILILINPDKTNGFYSVKFHVGRCEFSDVENCVWNNNYGGTQMIWVTVP